MIKHNVHEKGIKCCMQASGREQFRFLNRYAEWAATTDVVSRNPEPPRGVSEDVNSQLTDYCCGISILFLSVSLCSRMCDTLKMNK